MVNKSIRRFDNPIAGTAFHGASSPGSRRIGWHRDCRNRLHRFSRLTQLLHFLQQLLPYSVPVNQRCSSSVWISLTCLLRTGLQSAIDSARRFRPRSEPPPWCCRRVRHRSRSGLSKRLFSTGIGSPFMHVCHPFAKGTYPGGSDPLLFTRIGKITDSRFAGEEKNTGRSGFFEQDLRMDRMNKDSMYRQPGPRKHRRLGQPTTRSPSPFKAGQGTIESYPSHHRKWAVPGSRVRTYVDSDLCMLYVLRGQKEGTPRIPSFKPFKSPVRLSYFNRMPPLR